MRKVFKKKYLKTYFVLLFLGLLIFGAMFYLKFVTNVNNKENKKETADDIRVAAVGDSITYDSYSVARQGEFYPEQLEELLGDGYVVHNFGVSNYAAQSSSDFPYETTKEFQESLDFQPNIVIIMLGTNDTKVTNWDGSEQFKEEYSDLLANYQTLSSVSRIILASPPKAFLEGEVFSGAIDPNVVVNIRDAVEEVADEFDLEFVDVYEKTSRHPEYFPDGIHPDENGAAVLAKLFYRQIK
ncbi:GDSL-type esterase/lipase family protein [Tetragenococcus solitarius]|uniref:SGNH hydrolase-type esterase domain-containing protein n=1 Tax=Tetragenococcus solitarius TaxID=71453 RepID=A0ABN3YF37_9ENTE|nr:GDSL-type esterase/lipase family protein [Tetragenococcus solitarius]